jgi:hypothetical protein
MAKLEPLPIVSEEWTRAPGTCGYCLAEPSDGVLVRSVDETYVCRQCARRLGAIQREVAVPLVVAGLAEFLAEWHDASPDETRTRLAARRFWAQLDCYGAGTKALDVRGALTALTLAAPSQLPQID